MKRFGVADYDKYWESRFAEEHYQFTDVHRKIVMTTREILGNGTARVLDCGVGPGHVFRVLSEYYETFGIEISEKVFDLYDFDTKNITIGDLNKELPDYREKMDLVIASRIVHHMEDPALFIRRVRDVIKTGGWFMGIIPNICYYHHRLKFLFGKFPPISQAHVNFQTGPDFERMVTAEGFRLHKLKTPKKTVRAKLCPTLFSQDLIYVFQKQ